jgi:hypothetical protein
MAFLPFENIEYRSRLSLEEIMTRLSDSTEPEKTFRMNSFGNKPHKPYEGKFDFTSFNIRRIINYRNSFLPRIIGTINKDVNGLTINVKMKLHNAVIIFMFVWCSLAGLFSIMSLSTIDNSPSFNIINLAPIGMLILGYLLTTFAFKYESKKSISDLEKIFEATVIR